MILLSFSYLNYGNENNLFSKNNPPNCLQAYAIPSVLFPADQQFHNIQIAGVYDPDGDEIEMQILNIIQNEPVSKLFPQDYAPDAIINPLQLKAERFSEGEGRLYTIILKFLDNKGGICTTEVSVCVPLSENSFCSLKSSLAEGYISTIGSDYSNYLSLDTNFNVYKELIQDIIKENKSSEGEKKEFINKAPDCSKARPSIKNIYPADGKFHTISIKGIKEPENDSVKIKIDDILQDEPLDISANGNVEPSAFYFIDDEDKFYGIIKLKAKIGINQLRRKYYIYFTAEDREGAACRGRIRVCILSDEEDECEEDENGNYFIQGYDAMFEGAIDIASICDCPANDPDCQYCRAHGFPEADTCCSFRAHRTKFNVRERFCYRGANEGNPCEAETASLLTSSECNGMSVCNINYWTCTKNDPGCKLCIIGLPCPLPPFVVCEGSSMTKVCGLHDWCVGEWYFFNASSGWVEWDLIATAKASSPYRPYDCDCTNITGGTYASSSAKSYKGEFYGNPSFKSIQQEVEDAGRMWNRGWEWSQKIERGYYCAKLVIRKGDLVCQTLGTPKDQPDIYRSGTKDNPNFNPPSDCAPYGCVCP